MSHTFTLTGRNSVLSSNFYPPIELNTANQYGLALLGFYSYNSIFNINERNNSFGYRKKIGQRSVILHISPGAYEISDIEKAMITALQTSANDHDEKILSLIPNNNTLKCEIKSKYMIDFICANSIGKVIGFERGFLKSDQKHESTSQVDIMNVRIIRVDCNITAGAHLNSKECHILYEFDIDVEPGYKITKEPQNIIYMPLTPNGCQFIDNITLRILDDNGELIDFRGEKIIVKLELKKIS